MVSAAWYALLAAYMAVWLIFRSANKSRNFNSLAMGAATLAVALPTELFAVNAGLWNYAEGNWPWILWLTYFAAGMMGYEIAMFIRRKLGK